MPPKEIMKNKKIIIVLIMIISIFFAINYVYAENETGTTETGNTTQENNTNKESSETNTTKNEETKTEETKKTEQTETPTETKEPVKTVESTKTTETNTTNKNTTITNTTTKSTTTTTQTTTKSSNADLGNLGITPYDFSGFIASKTKYEVPVPNSVKSVEVYAKAKDSKATISGTGNVELKEGQNTEEVVVTAEDGTKKTYTIVITRLKEGEKIPEQKTSTGVSLKSLKVDGYELNSQFEPEKYEYEVNIEGEETSLNIIAEAVQSSDSVQILGNENLVDGKNIVNILVSDSKEENSVIYELTINKNFEKARRLQKEKEDAENWENIKKWGLRILGFVTIFGVMAFIIVKHKRSQYEDYEEDLPKSLRKSNKQEREKVNNKNKKSKGKHGK